MAVNQLKAGAILTYLQMGLNTIISLMYTPIMLRLLGPSEYGLFNLAGSIIAYLGFLDFGIGSSYVRYYYKFKAEADAKEVAKLNGLYLIVYSFIGILAIGFGLILVENVKILFSNGLNEEEYATIKILLFIMAVNIGLSFPLNIFSSYVMAHERFVFQKTINMLKTIVNPLIVLPLLFLGYKSIGMTMTTLAITIIVGLINIYYCVKKLDMEFYFKDINFLLLSDIARFSIFIAINFIIDQINWNVDKYLLGRFRGTVSVAVYSVAASLNAYYIGFSSAVSNVFVPRVYRLVSDREDDRVISDLFIRVGRLQFLVLALLMTGLIFFGKKFIIYWAGPNYSEAYIISLLLIIPVTVPLIQNLGIDIQRAKNKHHVRSIVYLILAIFNLIISIPLCKLYGGTGCAVGTALAILFGNVFFMNYYYANCLGINIKKFWREICSMLPGFFIPVIAGLFIQFKFNYNSIIIFFFAIMIYTGVYCFAVWKFSMNSYEKGLINSIVKKVW